MISRIWTKPQTQQTLKELRQAGYKVTKTGNGYTATDGSGDAERVVLKAMAGGAGYLIRYAPDLFTQAGEGATAA